MSGPAKVLITGGRGTGGVTSFAEALRSGFTDIGITVQIIPPGRILSYWRELRDPNVLKILSTTALFAAPLARRTICMAHGVARAHLQSRAKMAAVTSTFMLANVCPGTQLVAVSDYAAVHLKIIFDIRVDAVIRNPLRSGFVEQLSSVATPRSYITFAGRLDPIKNLHLLLPAIRDVLNESPQLRACVIGDGPQRAYLESIAGGDERIEFQGWQDEHAVRKWLRKTKVFVSGDVAEPLGIVYLEALSQGCTLAMPASGGGLEIAPGRIGSAVWLFPASLARESVAAALRRALDSPPVQIDLTPYSPQAVAEAYLGVDTRFDRKGTFYPGVGQ